MFRFDLHVHTEYSYDCRSPLRDVLKIAKKRGLSGLAITDHDNLKGALRAMREEKELMIIPGVEISTNKGHLLALGVEEEIKSRVLHEVIEEVHEKGGICVVPHPFYKLHHGIGEIPDGVDGVETFNSRFLIGVNNTRARKIAEMLKIGQTGGSDAHSAECVGFGYTLSPSEDVLEDIKRGLTSSGGRRTPLSVYARSSLNNMKKRLGISL
ncbi:MAG: PHP domain-containing protein [Archaeoglobi archaeon]|nr:PHP domain-containing protein [Candidatus Mnemosynella sp.]